MIDGLVLVSVALLAWAALRKAVARRLFSEEDEFDIRNRVVACPVCGSRDISATKHIKHWLKRSGPMMGVYYCPKCGYEGPPLELKSEADYEMLRDARENA